MSENLAQTLACLLIGLPLAFLFGVVVGLLAGQEPSLHEISPLSERFEE